MVELDEPARAIKNPSGPGSVGLARLVAALWRRTGLSSSLRSATEIDIPVSDALETEIIQQVSLRLGTGLGNAISPDPTAEDSKPDSIHELHLLDETQLAGLRTRLLDHVITFFELRAEPLFVFEQQEAMSGPPTARKGRPPSAVVIVTPDGIPAAVLGTDHGLYRTNGTGLVIPVSAGIPSDVERQRIHRQGAAFVAIERIRGGGKLGLEAVSRQGRYSDATNQIRIKELRLDDGPGRWMVLHDLVQAKRDFTERVKLLARVEASLGLTSMRKDLDLAAALGVPEHWLKHSSTGRVSLNQGVIRAEKRLDGKFVLWSSADDYSAQVLAAGAQAAHRNSVRVSELEASAPATHGGPDDPADRFILWLSLAVARVVEVATGSDWIDVRDEFSRIGELAAGVSDARASSMPLTPSQQRLLEDLGIPNVAITLGDATNLDRAVTSMPGWRKAASTSGRAVDRDTGPGMQTRVNKRRAPGEGRVLLLRAAREVFSEVGYADATTRGIADRAGIAEALLFRNFGNKAALFEEAALGPFQDFIEDWRVEQRRRKSELPTAKPSAGNLRMMVGAFYDLLRNNRGLVLAYIATSHFTPDVVNFEESPIFLEAIDTLARWSQSDFLGPRLHSSRNLRIANRAIVGMILSMALFDEWLLNPAGETPSREEIIEEMTQIILHGVTH